MKHLTLILIASIFAINSLAKKIESAAGSKPEKPNIADAVKNRFPPHWGKPPAVQTRDLVKLPGNFGRGSSTLARWIAENLKNDEKKENGKPTKPAKPVDGQNPKPIPPIQPILPEPPKEIKKKIELHKKIQDSLRKGLRQKIDALGEGATKEEVRKVVEAYRRENAKQMEDATYIGKQIQEWQKENRPERPKRPEPSEEVREKATKVRLIKNDIDIARKALGQELKGKSKEDAAKLIKAFKESQKELHKELKNARQDLLKEVREKKQTGDRRE
ncbi:MAG: hypothetical protein CL885_01915 [Dehalococcoidia bacterium]|nr:hypothetical protein [Dehalococcoidia bacterium]